MCMIVVILVDVSVHAARSIAHHSHIGGAMHHAVVSHNAPSGLRPPQQSLSPSMALSTSCPQQLDTRFLDSSIDSLQLTQMEIDAIRSLGRAARGSGASSASTPTSQLSQPDFVDPRPDIYRFVYDISPGSRSRASESPSVSGEGGDARPAELQQDSKFDEIVIASIEHQPSYPKAHHKLKTDSSHESEVNDEVLLQNTAGHGDSEPVPAYAESASHVASEPETHVTVTSTSMPLQSNDVVVPVGDALVAIQQGRELLMPEDEMQQPPATLPTDVPRPGPSRLHESISARIHKGSCISLPTYLIASCLLLIITILIAYYGYYIALDWALSAV